MKIKLITAAADDDPLRKRDPFMPLSLPLLAAAAPNHEYTLVDMFWDDRIGLDDPVDLVGISVRATSEARAYEIADAFRKRGVLVVLGGPHPSLVPLQAIAHADAVSVGEAEGLWPIIVNDAKKNRLHDFYVCSPRPFSPRGYSVHQIDSYPKLNTIPTAARHLMKRRYTFDTVFASRGCPIDCDFCAVSRLFGSSVRLRPVQHVISEIDTLGRYFYLLDDTVFGRADTYSYYRELYDGVARLGKKRFWTGQANLDAAAHPEGQEVVRRAVDSGLLYAAVGVESINEASLEQSGAIGKMGVNPAAEALAQMKRHIRFIQDLGVVVSGWFVIGYDSDTIDTYYRTYEFCNEMNIIPVVFPVRALPGTRLYERGVAEGRIDDSKASNLRHPTLRDNDVFEALDFIQRRSFSTAGIFKRTAFYARRFRRDRIHKTIFSLILQFKLRGGLDSRKTAG